MKELIVAIRLFVALTLVTGVAYPLLVTGISQTLLPKQANGSLIVKDGKIRGSELVGQAFTSPGYFWSRPSATGPTPYNASASSGSNLGPTNPALIGDAKSPGAIADRVKALREADPSNTALVPTDLVTASGSGLDPHISVEAALYQVGRVAKARSLPIEEVRKLVAQQTTGRTFGLLGEPVVNVVLLNLALDEMKK